MITNQMKMKLISKNTNLMTKSLGMRKIKIIEKNRIINSMIMNLGMKIKMNRNLIKRKFHRMIKMMRSSRVSWCNNCSINKNRKKNKYKEKSKKVFILIFYLTISKFDTRVRAKNSLKICRF
jgi:hypothetical protein